MQALRHPSFGPVPPDVFKEAVEAPEGQAAKLLRQYVPDFGLKGSDLGNFKVRVSKIVITKQKQVAEIDIAAASEDDARKMIDKMDWDNFKWKDKFGHDDEEEDDHNIDSVEAL